MKTCFNTISAGPDIPLEQVIEACGNAGFDGIEIDLGMFDKARQREPLERIEARLAESGVEVAGLMAFPLHVFGDPGPVLDSLRSGAELGHRLGAPTLLVFCGSGIPEGVSKAEALQRAGECAAQYADAAAPLSIALEPIGRTALMPGPDEALEVARISGRDNVGIMMDTFHYYLSEVPLDRVKAIPADKMLIVHVNDCEDLPIGELGDHHRLWPGLGILPLRDDFQALREIGYEGHLSLEVFRPDYWAQPVEETVRQAKRALDDELQRAGVAAPRS
jgi:2-keto-myo-inositol isomerase